MNYSVSSSRTRKKKRNDYFIELIGSDRIVRLGVKYLRPSFYFQLYISKNDFSNVTICFKTKKIKVIFLKENEEKKPIKNHRKS